MQHVQKKDNELESQGAVQRKAKSQVTQLKQISLANESTNQVGTNAHNGSQSPYKTREEKLVPIQAKQRSINKTTPEPRTIDPFQRVENPALGAYEQQMETQYGVQETVQRKANNTGLPDRLKAGIENLSGYSMDDVKVHYNSDKPAQLQAHAYAQGTAIHLGSGQEKHLPHEAWHVVQQKQGRVKPTMQMKGGVQVNDDQGLETEADVMGAKAMQFRDTKSRIGSNAVTQNNSDGGQHSGFVNNQAEPIKQATINNDLQEPLNKPTKVWQSKKTIQKYPYINSDPPERKDAEIYGIFKQDKGVCKECVYVGQTTKDRWFKRFQEHVVNDTWAPWHTNKYQGAENTWPYNTIRLEELKDVTRFEVTAAEQWWIENKGKNSKLLNNINAMTKATFNTYKNISDNYAPKNIQVSESWTPSK